MKQVMIGTWNMVYEGICKASKVLETADVKEAVRCAIQDVERNEHFVSVGYGGLPDKNGHVVLDSAYMDGDTLDFGGIIEAEGLSSAIDAAIALCGRKCNCLLAGQGAEAFVKEMGLPMQDNLIPSSYARYVNARKQAPLKAYEGHDTVCVLAKKDTHLSAGVSTSGLFLKEAGRCGDSAIIGSGFYSDSEIGSVAATGLGEDIMRGALSIRVLDQIKAQIPVQKALEQVLDAHMERLQRAGKTCDAISLIAMDKDGHTGAVTNLPEFPFIVSVDGKVSRMVACYEAGRHFLKVGDEAWLRSYQGD